MRSMGGGLSVRFVEVKMQAEFVLIVSGWIFSRCRHGVLAGYVSLMRTVSRLQHISMLGQSCVLPPFNLPTFLHNQVWM